MSYDLGFGITGIWARRLIIPVYFKDHLECLQGRAITEGVEPRYLTQGWRSCYYPEHPISSRRLVIVEGPFDLFAVSRIHSHVLATLGNQPSQQQIQQILSIIEVADRVSILYDRGVLAEAYALQLLLNPRVPTDVIELQDNKDAGECTIEQLRSILM